MRLPLSVLVISAMGLSVLAFSYGAERKISQSELPGAVQKTAQEQSKGATIKGYSKDTENGQVEYEVEMIVNRHSKDVTIAPDGRVLEIEEQVQMDTLPAYVQQAIKKKAGNGKITKVESLVKSGKLVAYEAQVKVDGKHKEIQVGPEGNALSREE